MIPGGNCQRERFVFGVAHGKNAFLGRSKTALDLIHRTSVCHEVHVVVDDDDGRRKIHVSTRSINFRLFDPRQYSLSHTTYGALLRWSKLWNTGLTGASTASDRIALLINVHR